MADSKRAKGFLPGSSTLDNPSVLSKLINNNAMEKLTRLVEEDFNLDEDDPGIFCYLLDESLKDAWDRLLRIRASYVAQYQIEVYLKSFYFGLPLLLRKFWILFLKEVLLEGMPSILMRR